MTSRPPSIIHRPPPTVALVMHQTPPPPLSTLHCPLSPSAPSTPKASRCDSCHRAAPRHTSNWSMTLAPSSEGPRRRAIFWRYTSVPTHLSGPSSIRQANVPRDTWVSQGGGSTVHSSMYPLNIEFEVNIKFWYSFQHALAAVYQHDNVSFTSLHSPQLVREWVRADRLDVLRPLLGRPEPPADAHRSHYELR